VKGQPTGVRLPDDDLDLVGRGGGFAVHLTVITAAEWQPARIEVTSW
jgi:hypothetical protein